MNDMQRFERRGNARKGRTVFITVWLAIFAAAFVLWAFFLGKVNEMLAEYESVQPKHLAQEVFDLCFADGDAAEIVKYCSLEVSPYDKENAVRDALASEIRGKDISYYPVPSADPEVRIYALAADGVRFADFTLVRSEEKTELLGVNAWKLGGTVIVTEPAYGVSVYAPKNAVVRINGIALTEEYITGEPVALEAADYFPSGDPDSRLMVNYRIDGLFSEPAVTVESADGATAYGIEYDGAKSAYSVERAYRISLLNAHNERVSEEERLRREEADRISREEAERARAAEEERRRVSDGIKALYCDFILEAMKSYAGYTHGLSEGEDALRDLLKYFKQDTPIYAFIVNYVNNSPYSPEACEFSGINMHSFVWADASQTAFVCTFGTDLVMTVNSPEAFTLTERLLMEVHVEIINGIPLISELGSRE